MAYTLSKTPNDQRTLYPGEIPDLTTLMDRALKTWAPGLLVVAEKYEYPYVIASPTSYNQDWEDIRTRTVLEKNSENSVVKQKEYSRIIATLEEFMLSVDEDLDSNRFEGTYQHVDPVYGDVIYPYQVDRIASSRGSFLQLSVELVESA